MTVESLVNYVQRLFHGRRDRVIGCREIVYVPRNRFAIHHCDFSLRTAGVPGVEQEAYRGGGFSGSSNERRGESFCCRNDHQPLSPERKQAENVARGKKRQ